MWPLSRLWRSSTAGPRAPMSGRWHGQKPTTRPSPRFWIMPERHGYPLERLESALLAAAITPGLRSILLFDAAGPVLEAAASALEQMLLIGTGRAVVRRYLGAAQH